MKSSLRSPLEAIIKNLVSQSFRPLLRGMMITVIILNLNVLLIPKRRMKFQTHRRINIAIFFLKKTQALAHTM